MRISLERDSGRDGRPVYRQIAEHIRAEIAAGALGVGDRLPPIRDLARRLEVNRDTVALAYEALADAGMVESAVGRGTFVAAPAAPSGPPRRFEPELSPLTRRLLDFERARPRFGSGSDAAPMHALIPDPALYPADAFRRALSRVLSRSGPELLCYGEPQGQLRLREVLAARLRTAGVTADASSIVLTHGASQGISLAMRLFARPGDVIALEEPTYNNVLASAFGLGLQTAPVPMRGDGVDLVALDGILARPEVKLLYTIPAFHNPMGITASAAHGRALLDIAARHGKPVVEDGYEMDLHFSGKPPTPLAALDPCGLVVHLFSFSKSLFPGVRVGSITAQGRLVDALLALKRATDHSDAMPLQAALAEFIGEGEYDRHLARLRRTLRARCETLLQALADEMPPGTHWTTPDGGYQVWVELPEGLDTGELLPDAVAAGVLFAPGSQFNHDGRPSRCLRLAFAMADEAQLRRGVRALARVVRERLGAAPDRAAGVHM